MQLHEAVPRVGRIVLACAGCFVGAASACTPVPWDTVGGVAQLPPEVQTLLLKGADMADPGWPFYAGFGSDTSLPKRRLILAVVGSDCVRVSVEQGGRGMSRYAVYFQREGAHWREVGNENLLDDPGRNFALQKRLGPLPLVSAQ